ncbi:O-succinylbenzoic acid--CoA ligase [Tenacibaculum holothuriorum]|uniref:O-succinylbenzoic acid--CoA ligase n=1 Tax=Tenacibaculum holothuriorum TaxID=1635173 RepID=A0A1Y2PCX2_9FLAO|nr:AMP-binding protein [Tenacibaculum holothuriorum]OSY88323.1 O-succinylbenzoic acid--CoA ligase [Tenacibaculum holothuriorum]
MQTSFHKSFKLNGKSFVNKEALLQYSKTINNSIVVFLTDWFNEQDFVVVQTSGSTGKPKPIQIKKEFMKNSALATGDFFNLSENTTALLCLSTDYIAGKMMLVRALVLGWELDIVDPISNPLKDLNKEYDFSAMVPLQLRNSLEELDRIKQLIVGGGVVANDLIEVIQEKKTKIFATYGMTETVTHIAVKKLNHFTLFRVEATKQSLNKKDVYKEEFYQTLPNVELSQDNRNCLVINAPKVANEQIVTNDVVNLLSETTFEWLGRFDNVINSGGVKLHPEKIEEKLSKVITQRFFVAGVSDTILGEKLILIVEDVNSIEAKKSLKTKLEKLDKLSKYEIPKEIYFVDQFIETETKKIQRSKTLDFI